MAGTWERRGTVTVTQNSNIVKGVDTYWTDAQNGPQVGNTFYGPDGQAHEVAVIRSATEVWLADNYKGATAAGVPYQIDTTRVDSIPGLASRVAAVLGFAQGQYDNLDKWTQGGVDEDVTLTSPNGESVTVPSLPKMGKDYESVVVALPAAIRAEAAATAAEGGASAAKTSETNAKTSETNALSSKNAAAAAASAASSSASAAAGSEASALSSAVRAEQAAQTVVGAIIDAGPYNAASGVLPTPSMSSGVKRSSVWRVTGGGTAGGIELGVGDSLVYTASDNSYYKIDNTESVYSVNTKKGAVTLSSSDVGADASGTAQNLVSQHASKSGAHAISGVDGLQGSLDSKYSASNRPSAANVTGLGTAASKNFGENLGQLMEVGAFGLGAVDRQKIVSLAALSRSGFYHTDAATMEQSGGALSYHAIYNMISSSAAMRLICPFNSPDIKIQIFSGGWGAAYSILHTGNSVKDANGFWKGASPVVRVGFYGDEDGFTSCGDGACNSEANGAQVARHAVGVYRIVGSGGFASDGWYIETPQDANGNKLRFVEYEYIGGVIEIRTFEPTYTNGRCEKGVAADIPPGRWVDVRLSMPSNKIGN